MGLDKLIKELLTLVCIEKTLAVQFMWDDIDFSHFITTAKRESSTFSYFTFTA